MTFNLIYGIAGCLLLTGLIWIVGPYSAHINFLADQGAAWYYWVLPEQDQYARISAWLLYLVHQASIWYLIFWAKRNKQQLLKSANGKLHKINYLALGLNLTFILLHIAQTKLYYDGLAQDTSNFAAQVSVILVLSLILILENPRRGLLLGKNIGWMNQAKQVVKEYHGYYFSWAMIFTFWFHPIETTLGHLLGNLYMFFFLLQASLIITPFHTNKYWRATLESFVVVHAVAVAYFSVHSQLTSMFGFGFLTMFFLTYLFGLGLKKRTIVLLNLAYWLSVLAFYLPDWQRMTEILRIPVVLYLTAIVLALVIVAGLKAFTAIADNKQST